MPKVYQLLLILLGTIFSLSPLVCAQPDVRIVLVEPDVRNKKVVLGECSEIKFAALSSPPGLQLAWIHSGFGSFDGETTGLASIYLVPDKVAGKSQEITITITGTAENGETAQDSVTFMLIASQDSAVPISQPTSTPQTVLPSPTPISPNSRIEQQLRKADAYFEQNRYTKPEKENAFEIYKEVLGEDPTNTHAREKIRQMAEIYKNWGDDAYRNENHARVEMYYQRYILIAQYMVDTLEEKSLRQELQEIEKRLQKPLPTPSLIPTPTVTPTGEPTRIPSPTPTLSPEIKELQEFENTLSQYLATYNTLKAEEEQGLHRNTQLISTVRNIIRTLMEIESTLEQNAKTSRDENVTQKIQSIQKTRQTYEQELLDRLIVEQRK